MSFSVNEAFNSLSHANIKEKDLLEHFEDLENEKVIEILLEYLNSIELYQKEKNEIILQHLINHLDLPIYLLKFPEKLNQYYNVIASLIDHSCHVKHQEYLRLLFVILLFSSVSNLSLLENVKKSLSSYSCPKNLSDEEINLLIGIFSRFIHLPIKPNELISDDIFIRKNIKVFIPNEIPKVHLVEIFSHFKDRKVEIRRLLSFENCRYMALIDKWILYSWSLVNHFILPLNLPHQEVGMDSKFDILLESSLEVDILKCFLFRWLRQTDVNMLKSKKIILMITMQINTLFKTLNAKDQLICCQLIFNSLPLVKDDSDSFDRFVVLFKTAHSILNESSKVQFFSVQTYPNLQIIDSHQFDQMVFTLFQKLSTHMQMENVKDFEFLFLIDPARLLHAFLEKILQNGSGKSYRDSFFSILSTYRPLLAYLSSRSMSILLLQIVEKSFLPCLCLNSDQEMIDWYIGEKVALEISEDFQDLYASMRPSLEDELKMSYYDNFYTNFLSKFEKEILIEIFQRIADKVTTNNHYRIIAFILLKQLSQTDFVAEYFDRIYTDNWNSNEIHQDIKSQILLSTRLDFKPSNQQSEYASNTFINICRQMSHLGDSLIAKETNFYGTVRKLYNQTDLENESVLLLTSIKLLYQTTSYPDMTLVYKLLAGAKKETRVIAKCEKYFRQLAVDLVEPFKMKLINNVMKHLKNK